MIISIVNTPADFEELNQEIDRLSKRIPVGIMHTKADNGEDIYIVWEKKQGIGIVCGACKKDRYAGVCYCQAPIPSTRVGPTEKIVSVAVSCLMGFTSVAEMSKKFPPAGSK